MRELKMILAIVKLLEELRRLCARNKCNRLKNSVSVSLPDFIFSQNPPTWAYAWEPTHRLPSAHCACALNRSLFHGGEVLEPKEVLGPETEKKTHNAAIEQKESYADWKISATPRRGWARRTQRGLSTTSQIAAAHGL